MFQYQNVPLQQPSQSIHKGDSEHSPSIDIEISSLNRPINKYRNYAVVITSTLLAIAGISVFVLAFSGEKAPSLPHIPMVQPFSSGDQMEGSSQSPFLGGVVMKSTFCKTSCSSPCSKFPSVYGELCCEWTTSETVGTTCALSVSPAGVCTCGAPTDSSEGKSSSPGETIDAPSADVPVVPVPKAVPLPLPKPTPKPSQVPSPRSQGGSLFQPWPTMGWIPMHPFPTMAWLPFNPIRVPDNATPCKSHCNNPCSSSMNNGQYFCCEASSQGCSVTSINGQCWCG